MARLQSNTRIYGTANVDTSIGVGGNVVVNTGTLFIGNSTINTIANSTVINTASHTTGATGTGTGGLIANVTTLFIGNNTINTFISTTGLTINNNANVSFRTINASAVVGMRQQSDDNFVFYSTNTAYGQRAIWSVFANSITSALSISTDMSASANMYFNSGFGSAGIAYGCRAWVSFSATTPTISNNGNVSSVTKIATGNFTVNFTSAMPDANYAFTGGAMKADTSDDGNIICQVGGYSSNTPKTTSVRCTTRLVSSIGTTTESAYTTVMVFR